MSRHDSLHDRFGALISARIRRSIQRDENEPDRREWGSGYVNGLIDAGIFVDYLITGVMPPGVSGALLTETLRLLPGEDQPGEQHAVEHDVDTYTSDDESEIGWRCTGCGTFRSYPASVTPWSQVAEDADVHEWGG